MTIVSSQLLVRFKGNRAARQAIAGVSGAATELDRLKAELKSIWADVRRSYSIGRDVKLSIELDGAKAGELRVKGTGRPYVRGETATAGSAVKAGHAFTHAVVNDDNTVSLFTSVAAARTHAAVSDNAVLPVVA